jgi:hypothetical protein
LVKKLNVNVTYTKSIELFSTQRELKTLEIKHGLKRVQEHITLSNPYYKGAPCIEIAQAL